VLKCPLNNSAPSFEFTANNKKLVFTDIINQKKQIFCLDLISGNILNLSDTNYHEYEPSVSSNGQFIAFTREEEMGSSIWVMNIDGSNRREVFYQNSNNRFPNFSPDNETIAFSSSYQASRREDSDIFIINKDGSGLENLFNDIYFLTRPMFSPNGESLIFLSNRRGRKYQDIFIINFETDEKYNITRLMDFINKDYSFTQEGNAIIFENIVYNNSDIFLFDLTTKTFKEIVKHPSWDSSPSI
jgi:Tol biopolymer transport system component